MLTRENPSSVLSRVPTLPCFVVSRCTHCSFGIPDNGCPWCRPCGCSAGLFPERSRILDSSLLGYPSTLYHFEFVSNKNDKSMHVCDFYKEDAADNVNFRVHVWLILGRFAWFGTVTARFRFVKQRSQDPPVIF
jgi:hypothetical protein